MIEHQLISLAESQEDLKQWEDAYKTYCRIYSDSPCDEVLGKIAWCASRANLFDQAIDYYTQLTVQQPQVPKWYYGVGYQYYMKKDWIKANEWFQKALDIYPDYFVVKYRLGYSLHQLCGTKQVLTRTEFWQALKQFDECDAVWGKMTAENKKKNASIYADICYQKGKMLLERNKLHQAIEYFNKSLGTKSSGNEDCEYQLSKAYFELGDTEKASEVLPKSSNNYYVIELKIDILIKLGELEKAVSMLTSHLQRRNKDYLHRKLAEIYLMLDKHKEAFQEASLAVSKNNKNHINHFIFARILFSIGLLSKAEEEAKNACVCKQSSFGTEYVEANELLSKILSIKQETNYQSDDQSITAEYSTSVTHKSDLRLTGRIDTYNSERGFGFITCNSRKYFFHISSFSKYIQPEIKIDLIVEFTEESTEKGFAAKNIKLHQ